MSIFEIAISITLMGLSIVFAVLLLLSLITMHYPTLINLIKLAKNRLANKISIQKKEVKIKKLKQVQKNESKEAPVDRLKIEETDITSEELIAVISAAAMYALESNKNLKYKIKSITPSEINYPNYLWKYAGVIENTNFTYFGYGE